MLRALFTIVLLLGLALPALAELSVPDLAQQLGARLQQQDIAGAVRLIEQNPQGSAAIFQEMAATYDQQTQEMQVAYLFVANVIARTFEIRMGDNSFSNMLASVNVLAGDEHWEGTVLARGATVATGPSTTTGPVASTGQYSAREIEDAIKFLLRAGNFAMANALMEKNSDPSVPNPIWMRWQALGVLEIGAAEEALQVTEGLIEVTTDPQELLTLELQAVQASREAARPAKQREHTRKAAALAKGAKGADGAIARFLVKAWQFEDEFVTQNPNMSVNEIMNRMNASFKELENLQLDASHLERSIAEWRWVVRATKETYLIALASRTSTLEPAVEKQLEKHLMTLANPQGILGKLINNQHIELLTAVVDLMQGIALEQVEEPSTVEEARGTIATMDRELGGLYDSLKKYETAEFKATGGDFSRLMVVQHVLRAKLAMADARGNFSPANHQKIWGEFEKAANLLEASQSLEVMELTVGAMLDYLFEARPEGWEQQAEQLITAYFPLILTRASRIQALRYRARLRLLQNRKAEAIKDLQEAVDILETYIREVGGGPASGELIRTMAKEIYDALAKAQLESGNPTEAFSTLGRMQEAEISGNFNPATLQAKVKQEDKALVTRSNEKKAEIAALEGQLVSLNQNPTANQVKITRVNQLLAQSRQEYYTAVDALQKKYPAFEKLDIKPINFSKLQRSVPDDTAVLLYFATEQETYIFLLTKENLKVHKIGLSDDEIQKMVSEFRSLMTRFGRSPTANFDWASQDGANLKRILNQLYSDLITPVEADLASKQVVAVIPWRSMMYLPFGALMKENRHFIEMKQVVVLTKAADLDQVYGPPASKTGSLVALGNPDGSLAAATEEVKALQQVFPDSKVYIGADATADRLKSAKAPGVAYLHLATHGNLDAKTPLDSYLTMAKGGKLSLKDIPAYELDNPAAEVDMSLVTLSACQTALGERDRSDGSDVQSLAEAFSYAGGRTLVASLWKVEDNSTKELMVEFYKGIKAGKSKGDALQDAQLALIANPKYKHPFFWAPFILIGDWR